MSVDLGKLIVKRPLRLEELNGRAIAIDAYNVLYQFLTIIRGPDGTPLKDFKGNVTSHLSGLFYRTIELVEYGIKPIYVFDGIPSMLKQKTIQARMNRREEAYQAWQKAKEAGEIEEARKFAIVDYVKSNFKEEGSSMVTLDGAKAVTRSGWFVIRASNTSPKIRLIAEAEDTQRLMETLGKAEDILKEAQSRITS